MNFLLDTNVCIDFLNGRFKEVTRRIREASPDNLCLSSVVIAELRYGADKNRKKESNHRKLDILTEEIGCADFDQEAANTFGRVRTDLERKGTPIGPYDMMIAAHALSLDLVLVTDNVREFNRVEGLRVENWRAGP